MDFVVEGGVAPDEDIRGAVFPLDCGSGIEGNTLMAISMHHHAV